MRATRKEVAEKAGVSTATVSYVLNGRQQVSEETRRKVLNVVRELNYKPDMIARSMSTKESKQLGIVLNDIVNPFFGEIVLGFENAAIDHGYFVNICTGFKNLDEYFENFITRRIDGVFIAAIPYKYHLEKVYELVNAGIKVVVSGNMGVDIRKVSCVENDHMDGMDQAVGYLTDLGHRNIAFLNGLPRMQKDDMKSEGYLTAVRKYGLPCGEFLIMDGVPPYQTNIQVGCNLTKKLIESGKNFSAVLCTNDLMAIGAIKTLRAHGYNIPGQVSVMGFDGIYTGEVCEPALTSMAVPKTVLGQKAFELLNLNMKYGNTGYFMNKFDLVIRGSTGPCRS